MNLREAIQKSSDEELNESKILPFPKKKQSKKKDEINDDKKAKRIAILYDIIDKATEELEQLEYPE